MPNSNYRRCPPGFRIKPDIINKDLARRQIGYGRGNRMKIETDTVEIKSGIRFGKTTGAPICLEIKTKTMKIGKRQWIQMLMTIQQKKC